MTEKLARQALELIRQKRGGEDRARQLALENIHPDIGPHTAHQTGYLILQDNSAVILETDQYLFRWEEDGHNFALTWPTSEATEPWPDSPEPPSQHSEIVTFRILEQMEDTVRKENNLPRRTGDDPSLPKCKAYIAAPDLKRIVHMTVDEPNSHNRTMEAMEHYLDTCVERIIGSLPDEQRKAIIATTLTQLQSQP